MQVKVSSLVSPQQALVRLEGSVSIANSLEPGAAVLGLCMGSRPALTQIF